MSEFNYCDPGKQIPEDMFSSGHRGCAGCGEANAVRQVLNAAGPNTVIANATGCLEVMTTGYPETAWETPWIHAAFENAASVASGVEAALKAMGRKKNEFGNVNVLAFGGDGATFDIGFQALSGMLERGHDVLYVVFDNEAYMNTGIQRSSATPWGASTTTSPAGTVRPGNITRKKPLAAICAAHDIPYTATATIAYNIDLKKKVNKALSIEGPKFLHIFAPCPTGWRYSSEMTVQLSRLAVETGVFPLWEVEGGDLGRLKITKMPKVRKNVEEYLGLQGRFRHIVKNPDMLARIQAEVDEKCDRYGFPKREGQE